MRVLITGASSLPGYRLSKELLEQGYDVIALYNKNDIPIVHDRLYKFSIDITDKQLLGEVFDKFRPDVVVHMAAFGDVDRCEKDKGYAWNVNVLGTRNVLLEALKYGEYFVYLSTDYVFDGVRGNYKEDDPPNPVNYYGLTKLAGELLTYASTSYSCIVRASSIYGVGPGRENFAKFLVKRLRSNQEVRALVDQFTSPTEASLLAKSILELLEKRYTGIFHVVGERVSRYEFAIRIADKFGFDKDLIRPAYMREFNWFAPRPRDSSLNSDKTRKLIITDFYSLKKALDIFKSEYEAVV